MVHRFVVWSSRMEEAVCCLNESADGCNAALSSIHQGLPGDWTDCCWIACWEQSRVPSMYVVFAMMGDACEQLRDPVTVVSAWCEVGVLTTV
jgi:hypothetical protein